MDSTTYALPVTPKQIAYARSLALRNQTLLPWEVQQDRRSLSAWIEAQAQLKPVSAMDPALSELTVALLNDEARQRGVTLVASLHAVDLALRHFPRVVGIKEGTIAFDLPADQVSEAMLRELYAAEGGLPVTHEPADAPAPGLPPLRCA